MVKVDLPKVNIHPNPKKTKENKKVSLSYDPDDILIRLPICRHFSDGRNNKKKFFILSPHCTFTVGFIPETAFFSFFFT